MSRVAARRLARDLDVPAASVGGSRAAAHREGGPFANQPLPVERFSRPRGISLNEIGIRVEFPSSSRISRQRLRISTARLARDTGYLCGGCRSLRIRCVGWKRRAPALADCALRWPLRATMRLVSASTPSDRRIAGQRGSRSAMRLVPNVPILGLDAPGAGGLLELASSAGGSLYRDTGF